MSRARCSCWRSTWSWSRPSRTTPTPSACCRSSADSCWRWGTQTSESPSTQRENNQAFIISLFFLSNHIILLFSTQQFRFFRSRMQTSRIIRSNFGEFHTLCDDSQYQSLAVQFDAASLPLWAASWSASGSRRSTGSTCPWRTWWRRGRAAWSSSTGSTSSTGRWTSWSSGSPRGRWSPAHPNWAKTLSTSP